MSFGIRNVTDVLSCLKEMRRVLKKSGRLLPIGSIVPKKHPIKGIPSFLPKISIAQYRRLYLKQKHAYVYLNKTIETFPQGESFLSLLKEAGFKQAVAHPLTGGMVTSYQGDQS